MSSDLFFVISSDDEDEVNSELAMFTEACQAAYEASNPKVHRTSLQRDRYGAHDRLVMAYFFEHPQYEEATFRDRFRMSRRLFTKKIREGCVPDSLDEYLQMGATTGHKCLENFYWPWANCPVAFKAQFSRGDHGPDPFILLEAIASRDLWIWHAFFGVSGMNNDMNVLRQSPLFNDLKSGRAPDVLFVVNNVPYKRVYYLTDGIYPQLSVLIKSIKNLGTNDHKRILYKTKLEAARKDVERAFEEQHRDGDPVKTHQESIATFNLTLPHQHPNPEAVVQEVQRRLNVSIHRRETLQSSGNTCLTGNPIDDCWRCDPNWGNNRQRLADCAIGFGKLAGGGKGGQIYVVTDSSDHDVINPTPGTLRYGVLQSEPLWIVFQSNMVIKLKHELIVNSYKTIDGRGAVVSITGNGCITVQYVSNVIIHNIRVYDCEPSGNTNIRSSPSHVGYRGKSDGDGISIAGSRNIWIDHCSLSHCTDGLIDAVLGSTAITISNSYFTHHNEVMLMGHDDAYMADKGMQVTFAFNHFGRGLIQRMPRCRHGYFHVMNNDFTEWKMYAIGGSADPTINSQGNRYIAPPNADSKEVTKRVDTGEENWAGWNWRTDGDIMVNGAFFVPSGDGMSAIYAKAASYEPKSASLVTQLTMYAGVFGGPRDDDGSQSYSDGTITGDSASGNTGKSSGDDGDYFGMIFGGGSVSKSPPTTTIFFIVLVLYITTTNNGGLFSSLLLL
nr:probable pectate lyase 5 [Tanacetum cinerariifolium]